MGRKTQYGWVGKVLEGQLWNHEHKEMVGWGESVRDGPQKHTMVGLGRSWKVSCRTMNPMEWLGGVRA